MRIARGSHGCNRTRSCGGVSDEPDRRQTTRPAPPIAARSQNSRQRSAIGSSPRKRVREQHGNTTTWIAVQPPDAVVFPQSTTDVQRAVRICAGHRVPIIPFGAGTSFEGSVNAPFGGVSIDLKDMNRVLAVHPEDFDCVVEPGITRKQLNEHLRDQGLFFPVDPGADASLGGMASTRASGTTAVRYGTMKDNVLALKVVLPNGELMSTSRRARKSSAGYDLTRLIVGAEGTLGVITELTLKLHGIPEAVSAGVCPFPRSRRPATPRSRRSRPAFRLPASSSSTRCRCAPATPTRSSACPKRRCCSSNSTARRPASPSSRSVSARSRANSAAVPLNGRPRPEDRTRLWQARHHVFWANSRSGPARTSIVTDVCVPISRLAECVDRDQARHRAERPRRADRRARRRRQLSLRRPGDDGRRRRSRARQRLHRPPRRSAPSPWREPAPASTGSARARSGSSNPSMAGRRRGHARDQARPRSRRDHESREDHVESGLRIRQPCELSGWGSIMRIAVFGSGGIGGYVGGRLAAVGEDVVFIARGDHLRTRHGRVAHPEPGGRPPPRNVVGDGRPGRGRSGRPGPVQREASDTETAAMRSSPWSHPTPGC